VGECAGESHVPLVVNAKTKKVFCSIRCASGLIVAGLADAARFTLLTVLPREILSSSGITKLSAPCWPALPARSNRTLLTRSPELDLKCFYFKRTPIDEGAEGRRVWSSDLA